MKKTLPRLVTLAISLFLFNNVNAQTIEKLESFPEAEATIFLDFDGQYVVDPLWNDGNPIDAQPSGFSAQEITDIWNIISEDFRPFNVNVTTDSTLFWAAPFNRRIRCIFTPTNFYGDVSGIASPTSFYAVNGSDGDTPSWVFIYPNYNLNFISQIGSHEIGHTFGLSHDGNQYPGGSENEYESGNEYWGPIMGLTPSPFTIWSNGDYQFANNQEDDLEILTQIIGFRQDESGGTIQTSTALVVESSGEIMPSKNYGIITQREDIDVYSFETAGGEVTIIANPAAVLPNLDLKMVVTDEMGMKIDSSDPFGTEGPSITTNLAAGTYYIFLDGTGLIGTGPTDNGIVYYSDYGSIGEYRVSGTIVPVVTALKVSQEQQAKCFPNPFNENFVISLDGEYIYKIYDINGILIDTGIANGIKRVGELFQPGIYTVQIESADGLQINRMTKF